MNAEQALREREFVLRCRVVAREIVELQVQLASQQTSPRTAGPSIETLLSASASPTISNLPSHMDQCKGSEEGQGERIRKHSPNRPAWTSRRFLMTNIAYFVEIPDRRCSAEADL